MFIKNPPFIAPKEAPFQNDRLGRRKYIIELYELMKDAETPLVMTVSAPWGSGKSAFIKMWSAYLEQKGHPCLCFNAWENDFNNDPLLSFMGEFGDHIDSNLPKRTKEKCKRLFKKPLKLMSKICDYTKPAATLFAPDPSTAIAISAGALIAKQSIKTVEEYAFKKHSSLKKSLATFKEEMKNFITFLTNAPNKIAPCYFFIDELDRCEPSYAVKLLEAIKHFFEIDGIIFILAIDKHKLGSMVRNRYGTGFDEDGYLKRFVDVEYQIPPPELKRFIQFYIDNVLQITTKNEILNKCRVRFFNILTTSAKDLNLSARDIERFLLRKTPLFLSFKDELSSIQQVKYLEHYGQEDYIERSSMPEEHTQNEYFRYPIEIYTTLALLHEFYFEAYLLFKQNKELPLQDKLPKSKFLNVNILNKLINVHIFKDCVELKKRFRHDNNFPQLESILFENRMLNGKESIIDTIIKKLELTERLSYDNTVE